MNLFVAIRVLGDSAITSASGSAMRNAKTNYQKNGGGKTKETQDLIWGEKEQFQNKKQSPD